MKIRLIAAALVAGTASLASAQLVGGALHGAAGAASGVTGTVSGSASRANGGGAGAVDPTPGYDAPTPSIVGHATQDAGHDAAAAKTVKVSAGARVQVARETRCYDGTDYWDPYYGPDGYYYCQTTGPGAAVGASVGSRRH